MFFSRVSSRRRRRWRGPNLLSVVAFVVAIGVFGPALLDSIETEIGGSPLEGLIAGVQAGHARIIDGDTLEIDGTVYRFWGVDAPEADAEFGPDATAHLERLTRAGKVRCEPTGELSYERFVARCYDAGGQDLAAIMVRDGWSIDWPHFSQGHYASDQAAAIDAGRGLYGYGVEPWH